MRTIECIAGWAHSPQAFSALADELSAEFTLCSCAVLDLPRDEARPAAGLSAYAAALLGRLRPGSLLCGWSMGAMAAIEAAAAAPERAAAVILLGATPRFCTGEGWDCGWPKSTLRAMAASLRQDKSKILGSFFRDCYPSEWDCHILHERLRAAGALPQAVLLEGLNYLQRADLRLHLQKVRCPVLVLHGEADNIVPAAAAKFMAALLPSCRLRIIEGGCHALCEQFPEVVGEEIRSFLAGG